MQRSVHNNYCMQCLYKVINKDNTYHVDLGEKGGLKCTCANLKVKVRSVRFNPLVGVL